MHSRHDGLGAPWPPRASAPPDNAAEDREEDQAADGGADTNDNVFVIGQPGLDFFGCGGALTHTL